MPSETVIRQLGTPQDRSSLIERFNPEPIIQPIIDQLLGIKTVRVRSGSTEQFTRSRYSKPMFAEEYVRVIEGILYGYVNNVTSFTKYDPEQIRLKLENAFKAQGSSLATDGDDNFISQETWKTILAIHESGYYEKQNGKDVFVSGWNRFNINWTYDSPVTADMLIGVKDPSEVVGQEVTFELVAQSIRSAIHSCFNRSLEMPDKRYGMTTNLVGETTIEKNNNTTGSTDAPASWN